MTESSIFNSRLLQAERNLLTVSISLLSIVSLSLAAPLVLFVIRFPEVIWSVALCTLEKQKQLSVRNDRCSVALG